MQRNGLTSNVTSSISFLLVALAIAAVPVAKASSVATRSGTDIIDWAANFGPEYNDVPNGSTAVSTFGAIAATVVFEGGGDGLRIDQGSGWLGNFSPDDALLWTNSPGQGPITFHFDQLLSGVGANIQADFFGDFTALLQVFDSNGNLLDSALQSGTSNADGDGSAVFLGLANEPGIAAARFSMVSCPCDTDFAMSSLAIIPVPEPSTWILSITALGLVTLSTRRKVCRSPVGVG